MGGPFDWSAEGKQSKLPRKIERMNLGTRGPEMKKSVKGENLPWGGKPAEQNKAYSSGPPKSKGSMISKTGERGKGSKAHAGMKPTITSKSQKIGK